jgi:ABC-type nitrate/sulfonate/bicarbonate transport system substrate-binding protein
VLNAIWFVPPAVVTIAEKRGLFQRYGVELRSTRTESSDEQFEVLLDESCDVAVTAMDNVIGWNRRGPRGDFRIVAQIEATTPLSLISRPEIASICDLPRRNLLVDSVENGFVVPLRALLAEAGIDSNDVRITCMGGVKQRFDLLMRGNGDATLLGPPFAELARQAGMRCLARVNENYPAFPSQGIIMRKAAFARAGDRALKWLRALDAARAMGRSDPAGARADLATTGLPALAVDAMIATISDTLFPNRAGIDLLIAQRQLLGMPGAESCYSALVDTQLLQQLEPSVEDDFPVRKGS